MSSLPTPEGDALAAAKAREARQADDRERLQAAGFLALRVEVGNALNAVQAVEPDTIETVIREAERRRDELIAKGDGDPAAINIELRAFKVLLDARNELVKVAKGAQAQADLRAGANGGVGIRDRLPGKRRGR